MTNIQPLKLLATCPAPEPTSQVEHWKEPTATELEQAVEERVMVTGLEPSEIQLAVLIGCRGGALLEAVANRLPALRDILVLEPDLESLRRVHARATVDLGVLGGSKVHIGDLQDLPSGYSHDLYAELVSFLLKRRITVANTLWIVDSWAPRNRSRIYRGAEETVHDLFWAQGARFMELLETEQFPMLFTGSGRALFMAWAQKLCAQNAWYAALRFFLPLYQMEADPNLATHITIAWGRLLCPQQALSWLERSSVPHEDRQATREELLSAVDQQTAENQRFWLANIDELSRAHPDAAETLRRVEPARADVVWLPEIPWALGAREGTSKLLVQREIYPLLVRADGGRLEELNPPEPPLALLHQLESCRSPLRSHACVGGMRQYGSLINAFYNRIKSSMPNWKYSLYAVEEHPAILRRLCETVDLTPVFEAEQLHAVFLGEDAGAQLLGFFEQNLALPLPQIRTATSPVVRDAFEATRRARENREIAARRVLAEHYDTGFPRRLLAKIQAQEPLRVWAWTSVHTTVLQYVTRDLIEGFRKLGHDVHLLIETSPREQIVEPHLVASSLAEFKPDVIVLLDHARPEFNYFPQSVPMICWILDELPNLAEARLVASLTRLDLAFAWSSSLTRTYQALGYPHCEQLGFAVDTEKYAANEDVVLEDVVAYATHLSFPPEPRWAPGLFRYLEQQLMALDELPSGTDEISPFLKTAVEAFGANVPPDKQDGLAYECLLIARHVDRVRVADAIIDAGLPIALYGRGWEDMERFRPYARGLLSPGPELCRMYQTHKVVLHINTRCNFHPRVLEAAASGGFVLARSDGDFDLLPGQINDFLEVGRELCVFTDTTDMVAKIRRAFEDEPWRQSFIAAGRARVHAEHTYEHRAAAMLESLQRQLQACVDASDGPRSRQKAG